MAYQIKRSCVFRTLRVLFFIGKLYGMTTFSYIYDDKTKVLVQHCDRIRFALFLLFYAILLVLNYTWSIASLDNTFTLFNTGIRYLLMYSITMVIFTVIYNFLFHQQLFNIIIQIDEHDLEVSTKLLKKADILFNISIVVYKNIRLQKKKKTKIVKDLFIFYIKLVQCLIARLIHEGF